MGALLGRLDWGGIERRSQNGPTIEDRLLFSGWDGGSAVPTTAACQDVFNLCDSEATTWLENGAQEAYPLEIYLEVDLSLKWMKKKMSLISWECGLYSHRCVGLYLSNDFDTVQQLLKEKFFSYLFTYTFFLLLIEHIVCGCVCGCKSTCVWAHIHVCAHTFGGQRTSLGIISQTLSICFSLIGRVSHWPGTGKVSYAGWTVSTWDPQASAFVEVRSQVCTTMPGFF